MHDARMFTTMIDGWGCVCRTLRTIILRVSSAFVRRVCLCGAVCLCSSDTVWNRMRAHATPYCCPMCVKRLHVFTHCSTPIDTPRMKLSSICMTFTTMYAHVSSHSPHWPYTGRTSQTPTAPTQTCTIHAWHISIFRSSSPVISSVHASPESMLTLPCVR